MNGLAWNFQAKNEKAENEIQIDDGLLDRRPIWGEISTPYFNKKKVVEILKHATIGTLIHFQKTREDINTKKSWICTEICKSNFQEAHWGAWIKGPCSCWRVARLEIHLFWMISLFPIHYDLDELSVTLVRRVGMQFSARIGPEIVLIYNVQSSSFIPDDGESWGPALSDYPNFSGLSD